MPSKKKTAKAAKKKTVKKSSTAKKNNTVATGPVKPFKSYGITRIDQDAKSNHGWYVRVNGVTTWFSDKKHGSRSRAFKAAVVKRDELFATLPPHRQARAAKKHEYSRTSL